MTRHFVLGLAVFAALVLLSACGPKAAKSGEIEASAAAKVVNGTKDDRVLVTLEGNNAKGDPVQWADGLDAAKERPFEFRLPDVATTSATPTTVTFGTSAGAPSSGIGLGGGAGGGPPGGGKYTFSLRGHGGQPVGGATTRTATSGFAGATRLGSAGADGGELGREPGDDPGRGVTAGVRARPSAFDLQMRRIYDAQEGELWLAPEILPDGTLRHAQPVSLKNTDVKTNIRGHVAATTVTQSYTNSFEQAIELRYVFPLPQDSAVNGFRMVIGERVIVGLVRRRAEAREIYENARQEGYTASLLEQERPNIFVQSIANVAPKSDIAVSLTYINALQRDRSNFTYTFPMVVAPRYSPVGTDGSALGAPMVTRPGHDITLSVDADAGVAADTIGSPTHQIELVQSEPSRFTVNLKRADSIPNRDFVLTYSVSGDESHVGAITAAEDGEGFVSLQFTPPENPGDVDFCPRELTFLLDTSGSMHGAPLDMSKAIVTRALDGMRVNDYFNIRFFAGGDGQLWEEPRRNSAENVAAAKAYIEKLAADGGTEMLPALRKLLASPKPAGTLRMIVFLTDAQVGNDDAILAEVAKNSEGSRFYVFGVGDSVNHYLIDGIGRHGRGCSVAVTPRGGAHNEEAVADFFSRIDAPCLTEIEVDWAGLPVSQCIPARVPDLFAGHPVNVIARYSAGSGASGVIVVRALKGGVPVEFKVPVRLPAGNGGKAILGAMWGRAKIAELSDAIVSATNEAAQQELREQITAIALANGLVSENTSFVAVDNSVKVGDGNPKPVEVPVAAPIDTPRAGATR